MTRRALWFVWIAMFSLSVATTASAADDHLKCYKVKDPLLLKGPPTAWLDLTGPQFGSEQCKVVGGFRLFCVPVAKTVTQPIQRKFKEPGSAFEPPSMGFESFTPDPLAAEVLAEDKLCYKIKCDDPLPAPPNPDVNVADQFGSRTLSKLQPFLVCGPAIKGTRFTFALDGAQETPPVATAATGSCEAILSDDHSSLTLSCTHDVSAPFAAHIHFAPPGVPGGIIHDLGAGTSPINDVWDQTDVPPLTAADVTNLLAGQLYVNVHSVSFIGGEIRGQIVE